MQRTSTRLINREYARLWCGQAVSTVGNYVFDTTLVLWIATVLGKDKVWAPAAVSGVMLSMGAAVLLVGPVAGVFVDRWDRYRTMLRSEVIRAVLVGALAIVALLPVSALPAYGWLGLVYTVVFAVEATGQFFGPARFAILSEIITGEVDRTRAAGIGQATMATAAIIGPPLGAPLLFVFGLQWALLINAASYLFSYLVIRSMRTDISELARTEPAGPERRSLGREFVEGLRFFAGNRILVALLTVAVIVQCGTGAMNALDVFFVTENLRTAPNLFGFMSTAFGVGAIAGSLWSGRVVQRLGARATIWLALLLTGMLFVGYSRQTHFWSGLVLLTACSIPVAMVNTALGPLLLQATPQEYLGRTMAVFNPVNQLASTFSVIAAGWLASTLLQDFHADLGGLHVGPVDTVFSVSGLLIVLAAGYAFLALPHGSGRTGTGAEAEAEPDPVSV
ncbi:MULTISPECIES: MFS transporter [Streptacidiphilus]|uniref:MFS transporter n=1 Tax=Streptacidiphilus cavernicola TaxID=3342716 RepID=A0ABV6UIE7_9ACTN|nr:MFS transporter [Streptacidiphilus jeojiense]